MTDAAPACFAHRFRIRYAEGDLQGIVFNSRYLEYADLLVTEYFRDLDLGFSGENSLEFHVARALVEYRQPIEVDEWIEGRIRCTRLGNSSMTTAIELHGEKAEEDLRAEIELVHVHVDVATHRSAPLPDDARAVLKGKYFDG